MNTIPTIRLALAGATLLSSVISCSDRNADGGVTPWFPAGPGTLPMLGLRAGTGYSVTLEARRAGTSVLGPSAPYITPPSPQALAGVNMTLVSGTPTMSGYTLTTVSASDGHGYLVAFDGAGAIRWYHDCGPWDTQDAVAGHQLLRISAAGSVDTLMQGWNYWTRADKIDPPLTDQGIDHPNSIDFDLDGGVIASFRNLGAVVKLDAATHKLLWQPGGVRNQFTFIGDPLNGFSGQHSVRVLLNGHFIVFDNGVTNSPGSSRAVEYSTRFHRAGRS